MKSIASARLASALATVLASCAVACTQAAGLDVHYAAEDASADGGAAVDGGALVSEGGTGAACPCDPTRGLGCCLPKGASAPYCAPNDGTCERASGVFLACTKSDPSTESVCCWSSVVDGGATPTTAALANDCGARARSCLADSDCAPGAKCHVSSCEGISMGVCGDGVAAICPVSE
jgi:hypothetical protein